MSGAASAIVGTITGCMGCMVVVEALAKRQPSSMNLMTFANFLFVAVEGLFFTTKFFRVPNKIPISAYLPTVAMFCFVNVINNQALNYHVPVPLHIIFRSGSLLTSLLMNRLILGRQFTTKKYLSVLGVTIGIIICTLATARAEKGGAESISLEEAEKHFHEWSVGIGMLIVALIASSALSILQERLYAKHGKHPREAMFYTVSSNGTSLALPVFALMGDDIVRNAANFSQSPAFEVAGVNTGIPDLWVYLFASAAAQWVCISFVYKAGSEMDSLSVTLLVTLRKFFSLLVSIVYFGQRVHNLPLDGCCTATSSFPDRPQPTKKKTN
ncbi:hypothetical protein M3Y99_00857000 [Aphelenchoides fujianensis]|nr:hypothetical protein M3Y99_00857000 [Aphelenchoides fujianensis]